MIHLLLAAIMSLSTHVGQAPLSVEVKVRPPHGVVCIQVWDKEVVGGELEPVRQSCWVQDRLDPPIDSRRYTLPTGSYSVVVRVDGKVIETQSVMVSDENPSNTPCRGQGCK